MIKKDVAAAILMEKIVRDVYSNKGSREVQPLQWSILRYLERASANSSDLTSIARFLGLTLSPVSRAVQTLERRGLVTKRPDPQSGRAVVVSLSSEGLATLEADPILKIAKKINVLPEDEREQFRNALRSLWLLADMENGDADGADFAHR
ncbi:MarR family winged helix-turn-helix transcriptional regulator [Roseibium sediminis]|uniref:MarR family winged helix-turn-helix transcriptional regulator n=1 Tax=Roseibium sediminis TaxID=1775174 RepID=UPI00123CEFAB|nr:MarR family transcriptional regulator [Roseibium sediminis]